MFLQYLFVYSCINFLYSLTRVPIPASEMMQNTIKRPPPSLTLLLVHWGEYCSWCLRRTIHLQSQPLNFDLSLKWTQSHYSSIHMCSEVNFNLLIFFFLEFEGYVEATRLFKFISLSLREIVCLDILMPKLALTLLEISVAVANRFFIDSLSIHLPPLEVVFLGRPGCFLASHDPVSSSFLKILWITLLDFLTDFEISPIERLYFYQNKFIELYIFELCNLLLYPFSLLKCSMKI